MPMRAGFSFGRQGVSLPAAQREGASLPAAAPAVLPDALLERLPDALSGALLSRLARVVRLPHEEVEEIRLRADRFASLTVGGRNVMTDLYLSEKDLSVILTGLCGGSLYACAQEIADGFLSLPDGIRVGVAGYASCEDGRVIGLTAVTGLCIRLPHPFSGGCGAVTCLIRSLAAAGSAQGVLIYGPPGVGKTTLLRAAAHGLASGTCPLRVAVVDTRRELACALTDDGLCLDLLSGYPRAAGVGIAVRTLNAQVIVLDEIGDLAEAEALAAAHRGGVPVVASAHAGSLSELLSRPGLRLLHDAGLFGAYVRPLRDGRGGFTYTITPYRQAESDLREVSPWEPKSSAVFC